MSMLTSKLYFLMTFLLCSSCIKHLCGFPSKFFKSKSGLWGEKNTRGWVEKVVQIGG